jgi:hypothetical protein
VMVDAARRRQLSVVALFGAVVLLLAGPFYLYNYTHTGNPVFPFAASVFGAGPWNGADLAYQLTEMRTFGIGHDLAALVRLPWVLTYHQNAFHPEGHFPNLLLFTLPIIVLFGWRMASARRALAFCLCFGLFWFATMQILRYLVPASALFALVMVLSVARLGEAVGPLRRWLHWRPFAWVLCLAALAPAPVYAVKRLWQEGFPLTASGRHAYLAGALPGFEAFAYLNRTLGDRCHLYAYRFERMFYYADGTMWGDWFGPGRYADFLAKAEDPQALLVHLRTLGVTHLLLGRDEVSTRLVAHPGFREHFGEVFVSDDAQLFELRS